MRRRRNQVFFSLIRPLRYAIESKQNPFKDSVGCACEYLFSGYMNISKTSHRTLRGQIVIEKHPSYKSLC